MKDVLVFGATGFLGRHVARALRRAVRPTRAECDVTDPDRVRAVLTEHAPELVVNCAALSRAADCAADPEKARQVNVEFPRVLAEWSAERGARLLHVSTDLVFAGDAPPGGYRETDDARPVNEYGESKLAGERAVLAAYPAALVVRLPLLFGDSFGRGLGASDSILAAVAAGERPRLFTDEWRTPSDAYLSARTLSRLSVIDVSGILHAAGSERLTRFELGAQVLAANKRSLDCIEPCTRADAGMEASRPRDVSLNCERYAQLPR